jgi:subtilisin family serine protease
MGLTPPSLVPSLSTLTDEGNDPLDCDGHGTHVSGIIAADTRNLTVPLPFVGVAPGVTINMYRVFGCNGTTESDILIEALTRAFDDGVQIISMSIGGVNGWSEDPLTVVANRIVSNGVFLSIAGGNEGISGLFEGSGPATASEVAAVGSINNIADFAFVALTQLGREIVFPIAVTHR